MNVGVWMPRRVVGRYDSVPYYGFGRRDSGRRTGGVGGCDVEEDLLGVPVEEGGEFYMSLVMLSGGGVDVEVHTGVEVKLHMCVLLSFGAVVVRSSFHAVMLREPRRLAKDHTCGSLHLHISELKLRGGCLWA